MGNTSATSEQHMVAINVVKQLISNSKLKNDKPLPSGTLQTRRWRGPGSRAGCSWWPSAKSFTTSSPTTGSTSTSCDQPGRCDQTSVKSRASWHNHHHQYVTQPKLVQFFRAIQGSNMGPQPQRFLSTSNTQGSVSMYNYEDTAKINAFVENF